MLLGVDSVRAGKEDIFGLGIDRNVGGEVCSLRI